jgi:hypothetical protein
MEAPSKVSRKALKTATIGAVLISTYLFCRFKH